MSQEFLREVIEHGVHAKRGMSPEVKEDLQKTIAAQTDWRGQCSLCDERLYGTVAEIRAHQCPRGSDGQ